MSKRLCIVIPMYNSEEFIERTLSSIINSNLQQDYYDILVINDGSTDNGAAIVEGFTNKYPNVQLINQRNGGSSKARNTGIDYAAAEYIWFFDSDDMAESDLSVIPKLLNRIPNIDVYAFYYNWIKNGEFIGIGGSQPSVTHNQVMDGRDAIIQGYTPGSVCGLLLRKDFICNQQIRFTEGITQQDVVFTYRLFSLAKQVYFSTDIIYNYLIRQNSISKANDLKRRTKYLTDKVEVIKSYYELASFHSSDKVLSNKIHNYADGALFGCVYSMYRNRKRWKPLGINKAILAKLKEYNYYPLHGPFDSWKKRAMSLILNREFLIR